MTASFALRPGTPAPFVLPALLVFQYVIYLILPAITRPEIFFSITVPANFRRGDAGRSILTAFRREMTLHFIGSALLAIWGWRRQEMWMIVAALLWQIAGMLHAFLAGRGAAKPHAVEPTTLREAEVGDRPLHLPGGWPLQFLPFILLAALGAYLNANWSRLPDSIPQHWNFQGVPDRWTPRSFGAVYGVLLGCAAACALMFFIQWAIVRGVRIISPVAAAASELRFRRFMAGLILAAEFMMVLMAGYTRLLPVMAGSNTGSSMLWVIGLLPAVFAIGAVIVSLYMGQGGSRLAGVSTIAAGVQPIGDRTRDRYWKLGLFYANRSDPAIFVEKRFGIGYTLNFGHPVAWILTTVPIAAVLAAIFVRHR